MGRRAPLGALTFSAAINVAVQSSRESRPVSTVTASDQDIDSDFSPAVARTRTAADSRDFNGVLGHGTSTDWDDLTLKTCGLPESFADLDISISDDD